MKPRIMYEARRLMVPRAEAYTRTWSHQPTGPGHRGCMATTQSDALEAPQSDTGAMRVRWPDHRNHGRTAAVRYDTTHNVSRVKGATRRRFGHTRHCYWSRGLDHGAGTEQARSRHGARRSTHGAGCRVATTATPTRRI